MQSLCAPFTQVSTSNTSVLFRGETGVGKELVAHAIHHGKPTKTLCGRRFKQYNTVGLRLPVVPVSSRERRCDKQSGPRR